MNKIKIAIVDDHTLISKAIENMVSAHEGFVVVQNNCNGQDFLNTIENQQEKPNIVLMDINMPFKNGIETTQFITEKYPDIKVIALTMEDDENTIIKMLRAGAKGYLLKDMQPTILFEAIETVYNKGSFYTDMVTQTLLKMNTKELHVHDSLSELKDKEIEFIKYACSELTYREIAEKMCLSPKTIDGYRDSVFLKLDVKSRVGLALFAIKSGIC